MIVQFQTQPKQAWHWVLVRSIFTMANLVQKDKRAFTGLQLVLQQGSGCSWEGGCRNKVTLYAGSAGASLVRFTLQGIKCSTASSKEELFYNFKPKTVHGKISWETGEL